MAERRMFAKTIVLSDDFLDMPPTARCLYFTLGMFADDDGFVNSPRGIMRQCGATDDDMKILLAKKFLIAFSSGVIVIKHWRINNYLQKDRYKTTVYEEEKALLDIDEKGNYHRIGIDTETESMYTQGMYTQDVYTQDRLGKDRLGKDIKTETRARARVMFDDSAIPSDWSESMKSIIRDWFDYKTERKEYYKERGWKSLISSVELAIKEHGEESVIRQITDSMGNNYKGMGLDRIVQTKKRTTSREEVNHSWERKEPENFDNLLRINRTGDET